MTVPLKRKLATKVYLENECVVVQYHDTQVVRFNDDTIWLDNGGWETHTTKQRMNQAALEFDLNFYVFQSKFVWYVSFDNKVIPFSDKGTAVLDIRHQKGSLF